MSGIGELSRTSGCPIETIRYYEKVGLLPPPVRSAGGHRIYSEAHLSRLVFIRQNRELGFPLADIRELMTLAENPDSHCGEALTVVQKHLSEVESKVAKLQKIRSDLLRMASNCESVCLGAATSDCTIVEGLFPPAAGSRKGCCS